MCILLMQEALVDLRRKATTYSKHDLEASPPFCRCEDVGSDFRSPQKQIGMVVISTHIVGPVHP